MKKLDELRDRIEFVRKKNNLTKRGFSERLCVSAAYVTELESGKGKKLSKPLTKLISYEFGVNSAWIETGDGEIFIQNIENLPGADELVFSESEGSERFNAVVNKLLAEKDRLILEKTNRINYLEEDKIRLNGTIDRLYEEIDDLKRELDEQKKGKNSA